MSDFAATWHLVRKRFDDAVAGLSHEQLTWRLHPGVLTVGEMATHVAGVEVSFISQLLDKSLDGDDLRLKAAATEGAVNDNPFPFSPEELTPERIAWALARGREMVTPIIENLTPEVRAKQIVSALGPVIDGSGAMARLAYHPGYHQGQVQMIVTAPGFPK